ncbi:MAG TPA: PQQ-dependent sugar dehydrogenase, partial [Alkalispirochaeta sp.]|nr:PQQ-dependent sugar dehydrogenase [Alkalispirochaeta sp.]
PLLHWTPSIAPSGMTFVTGDRYPQWRDDVLVGALAGQHLRRVQLDPDGSLRGQEAMFSGFARFRDVRQGPDGYLFVLTDARRGGMYRIEVE